jgi:hypothetical protein
MEKTEKGPKIYLGVEEKKKLELGNGQFIEYKKLNAGDKDRYQDKVKTRAYMNRKDQDEMAFDITANDIELANICVTDFMLLEVNSSGTTEEVRFTSVNQCREILKKIDSDLMKKLVEAIRELNTWLIESRKPDEIRKEIDRLEKELKELEEKEKK